MGSSLLQWESDPLFSAAEVVQDSADRTESVFRLLWHEQSLVQVNNYDPKLLTSIGYHRRDLATILETAKWQLEDFERAVNSSARRTDLSHSREDLIFRHKEFISAIREQINNVEKSLEEMTIGYPAENSEWRNLNEQDDDDGLALFLSGGNQSERNQRHELDDSDVFKRFLDPAEASCSDAGIVGNECGEIEEVSTNGIGSSGRCYDSMEGSNVRKVDSQMDSFQESSYNWNAEDGSWDLEASEGKPKRFFPENKLRGTSSRVNLFGFVNNLWTAYGSRVPSSYTKRLKDGDEEHSPLHVDASHAAQGRHIELSSAPGDRGLRGSHGFLVKFMHLRRRFGACNQRPKKTILAIVFAMTLLGILVFCIT